MNKETITLRLQSQTHSQLISIVENPNEWDKSIVEAAEVEINKRGGAELMIKKISNGEDLSIISVAERKQLEVSNQTNTFIKWGLVFAVLLCLTLPFHYTLTSKITMFPKENLTFEKTFILQSDVDEIIEQYNSGGAVEKMRIEEEALTKHLVEKGLLKRY